MMPEATPKPYLPLYEGRHPLHDKLVRGFLEHGRAAVVARAVGISRSSVNRWLAHHRDEVLAARKALMAKAPTTALEQRLAALETIVFGGPKRAA